MRTEIETITPEYAMEVLEKRNPRNRTIAEQTVQAYANDMKNNRWVLTHQGLAFDVDGNLLDGQHRLWAVVFHNKPVEFNVTRGIPKQEERNGIILCAQDAMDAGRVRGTGAQLTLAHGIKNGSQVAACMRGIISIVFPEYTSRRISTANTLYVYEQYGQACERILEAVDTRQRVSHITAPLAMYCKAEPEKAVQFATQLKTLEDMSSPVRFFAQYLERQHSAASGDKTMRIHAKCLMHFNRGEQVNQRLHDDDTGYKFLFGLYPSLNTRIRQQVKPISGQSIKKILNKKQ